MKLLARELGSGRVLYLARFVDADGRRRELSLGALGLTTAEARRAWAITKATELAKAKADAAAGIKPPEPGPEPVTIATAIDRYLADANHRLRGKTITTYGLALAQLRAWAKRERVTQTADLTGARLASLRAWLVRQPKRRAKAGGKRGTYARTKTPRSPVSVNRELRTLATVLTAWRRAGLVPLSSDEIADGLRRLPQDRELPAFLSPTDLERVLAAALRHDAVRFKITRAEHDGAGPIGSTLRHAAIAPFVAFVLLTGCRRGEALALTWADVDLEARDSAGTLVGEVKIRADVAKTRQGRVVGLEVSPRLRRILAAMKLRAGRNAAGERVFRDLNEHTIGPARARLVSKHGAPSALGWQVLRSTCSTFLVNAPSIYGSASAFMAARQLGHSVVVAEKRYAGLLRGVPREARTLDDAMNIGSQLDAILAAVGERPAEHPRARRRVRIA